MDRYKKLDNEKKKKVRDIFADSKKGRELKPILDRLLIESILSFICAFVMIIISIGKTFGWYYWVLIVLLFVGGIVFYVQQFRIRKQQYEIVAKKFNIR